MLEIGMYGNVQDGWEGYSRVESEAGDRLG